MGQLMIVIVAALIGLFGLRASAADLQELAEFVRPAYTAMSFAAICVRDNANFLTANGGPRGTALHYAEHVKDEAIAGLSQAEAESVLKAAADAARATARAKLRELARPGDNVGTVQAVVKWCDEEARSFILEFIRHHDSSHQDVEEFLTRAKR